MADFRQKKRIGDMLLEAGIITQEQLEDALEKNKTAHKKIGEMLVDLGYATEEAIGEAVSYTHLDVYKRQDKISTEEQFEALLRTYEKLVYSICCLLYTSF